MFTCIRHRYVSTGLGCLFVCLFFSFLFFTHLPASPLDSRLALVSSRLVSASMGHVLLALAVVYALVVSAVAEDLPAGKWVLIFRQKDATLPGGAWWPGKAVTRINENTPDAPLYSRLDELVSRHAED